MNEDREYEAARARLHARNRAGWNIRLEPLPPPAPPKSKHPKPPNSPVFPSQRKYPKYRDEAAR